MIGLTPFYYLLEGMLATVVHKQPVVCTPTEFATFVPPAGQTCEQWAGLYVRQNGGYIQDPTNTSLCQYCSYANGDQYVRQTGHSVLM
jgi:ATP-binding cassette, subfamily G (WHITE), member 2, PDR